MAKADKRNAWILLIIWTVAILILTLLPAEDLPKTELVKMDKVIHLLEFFTLGLLLMNALLKSKIKLTLHSLIIIAIVAGSIYGGIGEWLQNFVEGRSPDIYDFVSDLLGLNLGIFMYVRGVREWHL